MSFHIPNVFLAAGNMTLGCFRVVLGYNSFKCCQIRLQSSPVMQCKATHQIVYSFHSILNKLSKVAQKTGFLAHFERFFVYALLHPMIHAPILTPNERFHEDI